MPLYLRTYGHNQLVKVRNDEPSYQIKTGKQITSSTHNKDNSTFLRANLIFYASVADSHTSVVLPSTDMQPSMNPSGALIIFYSLR